MYMSLLNSFNHQIYYYRYRLEIFTYQLYWYVLCMIKKIPLLTKKVVIRLKIVAVNLMVNISAI